MCSICLSIRSSLHHSRLGVRSRLMSRETDAAAGKAKMRLRLASHSLALPACTACDGCCNSFVFAVFVRRCTQRRCRSPDTHAAASDARALF